MISFTRPYKSIIYQSVLHAIKANIKAQVKIYYYFGF